MRHVVLLSRVLRLIVLIRLVSIVAIQIVSLSLLVRLKVALLLLLGLVRWLRSETFVLIRCKEVRSSLLIESVG